MKGKIIIISAPSGCGKSTIINAILRKDEIDMQFSISATNRPPRDGEKDGVNYYFLTDEEFQNEIKADSFVEFEEVYPGRYYGTLKREIARIVEEGHNVILDIDVKGGVNVKKLYGDEAMSIFILPPSVEELRHRLEGRGTETSEWIDKRIERANLELDYAGKFDHSVVNADLDTAVSEVENLMKNFVE